MEIFSPKDLQRRALAAGAQQRDHLDGLRVVHDHALHEFDVGVEGALGGGSDGRFGENFAGLARRAGLHDGGGLLRRTPRPRSEKERDGQKIDCKEPCVTIQFAFSESQNSIGRRPSPPAYYLF